MLFTRAVRMSASRSGPIVSPTIFAGSISNSTAGGSISRTTGTFAALWAREPRERESGVFGADVAEGDRERRLRRARDPDEDDVCLVEPAADAVVVLHRELDRLDPL